MKGKKSAGSYVSVRNQQKITRLLAIIIALISGAFIITPLFIMLLIAFQPPGTLFASGEVHLFTGGFSIKSFQMLFEETDILLYFKNSIIITGISVLVSTSLAISAGYSLTRFNFDGKTTLARLVLFSYMFSPIILAIPLYIIFYTIGILNTYLGVILGVCAISTPFNIWLMWQYFQTVPIELEEYAWTRGASRWRALWDIVLPIARPGYVSAAIFSFAVAWNDFTISRIVLNENSLYPVSVGAKLFLEDTSIGWGETMATAILICIPPFIVALTLQNYLLRGFSVGGLE